MPLGTEDRRRNTGVAASSGRYFFCYYHSTVAINEKIRYVIFGCHAADRSRFYTGYGSLSARFR